MVQERDLEPRKVHHVDLDRVPVRPIEQPRPRVVSPPSRQETSGITDAASGLALLLSLIAFFFSCYAVAQAVGARRQFESSQTPSQSAVPGSGDQQSTSSRSNSFAEAVSRPILPLVAPYRFQTVEPGEFIQPTLDKVGEVELLSANRVSPDSNLVNVQMRIRRVSNSRSPGEVLNLNQTIALNTRTNERFLTQGSPNPENLFISLDRLRPGQAVNASITLRVPTTLNRIDLEIPETRPFRNVPIS